MMNLWGKAINSTGLKQSALTVVGNFIATGFAALAIIIISRLLGPRQFGEFSVGFAIIIIMSRVCDVGLNATILKYVGTSTTPAEAERIFNYTTKLKLLITSLLILSGFLITPLLSHYLRLENPQLLYLAFGLSFATTLFEHYTTLLQALHNFSLAVFINIFQAVLKLVGIVLMWLWGWPSVVPIFTWYMIGPVIPFIFLKRWIPSWSTFSATKVFQAVKDPRIVQMARHSAVGFIAAGLIDNLDILFVQGYLSSYETGLLGGVSRISMVLSLMAYSLGSVLNPRVARYQTRAHLQAYVRKALIVALLAVIGFIASLPFLKLLITLTIGPEYLPGEPLLMMLMGASFLTIATIPFLALFYSLEAHWYFSVSGVLQLLIVLMGNGLFVPEFGLEAAAWTRLVSKVVLFTFTAGLGYWVYHRKYVRLTAV